MLLCAFGLFNVRLMLLSGIGTPYDPASNEGVVGRNYAYQTGSGSTGFFPDALFNPFAAAGSLGVAADDYNSDNFDHGPHGFVGGASLTVRLHQRPPDPQTIRRRPARRTGAANGNAPSRTPISGWRAWVPRAA